MTSELAPEERHMILHSLGLTPRNGKTRRWSYRNHFYTAPDSEEGKVVERLVKRGLMTSSGRSISDHFEMHLYHVTAAGAAAAGIFKRVRKEDRV